ncbi:MAG: hypothetical protein LPK38_07090, partial [Actinomycetes bacterium]|nr:hypothetical protein [Actinomycetes bacterium]MDX5381051.1 hypothetical protein [Actinomycetes bacterium]MDX5400235.1 hypothetical protein [Actinomycetes bacterium]MDX5450805.1 hypothetical protein [Actinomycetes bacterium]
AGCSAGFAALAGRISAVKDRIAAVVGAVAQEAPNAEIYVTGYPYLFGNGALDPTSTCDVGTSPFGDAIPVEASAAVGFNLATDALNGAIAAGVAYSANPDATFVDVSAGSLTHGVCGSGEPWINGVVYAGPTLLPMSFHPNLEGSQAYADAIEMANTAD